MKKGGQSPTIFLTKNRKGVIFAFLLVLVLSSFLASEANETDTKAYSCLEDKVKDKCSTLSTEEKIFSLLTIERCKAEVLAESLAEECWPSVSCKIKTTAQAILALKHVNTDTLKAESWLLSKKANFMNLEWFLQVDSDENETSCTATYSGSSYTFTINEDKTIDTSAGNCLRADGGYKLKIPSTCYDYEFKISCRDSFRTSLLYKKSTSSTLYVPAKTNSASAEGTTTEKVSASCFEEGGSCNYEGTLWAAVVLKSKGHVVSSFIPYLVVMADENEKYIPEAFLYSLTNNFKTELLAIQQESKFWLASGDKFYDTAIALLPFQNEQLSEKTGSKDWLAEVQGEDGCWQGNIRNTAFLLYSLWPKKSAEVPTAKDCEISGYDCMSSAACSDVDGSILTDYTGCELNVCCSKPEELKTCSEQDGEICDSDETCIDGNEVDASDTSGGKFCCVDGECGIQEQSECEIAGGSCKSLCSSNEQFKDYLCDSGDCCVAKEKSNLLLIIILSVLIVLVVLGIIFRKKLKAFFAKLKFKIGKGKGKKPAAGGPRFPPTSSQRVYPGAVQRRIFPQARPPSRKPLPQKKSEFDDVLKKLKEIGK